MSAKIKQIETRMKSVETAKHITKAMELAASAKLTKARERVERSRPYFQNLHDVLLDITYRGNNSVYANRRTVKTSCFVVMAGDRGFAGGYNNNIFKAARRVMSGKNAYVLPIGKKTLSFYKRQSYSVLEDQYASAEDLNISKCFEIAYRLCIGYLNEEFDEVFTIYSKFVSALTQTADVIQALPLDYEYDRLERINHATFYEPSAEAVFNAIVPEYVAGLLYGAHCESAASELGARRASMEAANKNADELIEKLEIEYNGARQSAITQEITEIIAGSQSRESK
jgi:F-type H+-transporting ATPase subunit gamma